MIIWLAMLIPLMGCFIAYLGWKKEFVWWELLLPSAACFLLILGIKYVREYSATLDKQYLSGLIVEARYYEAYSTWITETCSEQYQCGTDSKGHAEYCTRYYDCSHCDEHDAYWMAYDNQGHSWSISEQKYNDLRIKWKSVPVKIELNRNIDFHGGCGKDGDAYSVTWKGDILTSESSTWSENYKNKVQTAKANFDLLDISHREASKLNLYEYPGIDKYSQETILGLDSLKTISDAIKRGTRIYFNYFNGYYGPIRKIHIFVLMTYGKPIETAVKQKYYWDGGNKNEVVICIDVNKNTGSINWVYPFTWTTNKRIEIDLRNDIANIDKINFLQLYRIIEKDTEQFQYRDFKEFDYLQVDPSTFELWLTYILTSLATIGLLYYGFENQFELEE
jgi:hypothetical protein